MNMLYDFGINDKEFSINQNKMGLPDLQLYDLSQVEVQDAMCINLTMQKFRKGFHYLFKKYANSINRVKPASFDK